MSDIDQTLVIVALGIMAVLLGIAGFAHTKYQQTKKFEEDLKRDEEQLFREGSFVGYRMTLPTTHYGAYFFPNDFDLSSLSPFEKRVIKTAKEEGDKYKLGYARVRDGFWIFAKGTK